MTNIKDGGPAFPRPHSIDEHRGEDGCWAQDGMSLRDWFAGKAFAVLVEAFLTQTMSKSNLAREAYSYAEAMLEERKARYED